MELKLVKGKTNYPIIFKLLADTLRYDITAENATTTTTTATTTSSSIDLPSEFGQSTLVIDAGGGGSIDTGRIDTGPTIIDDAPGDGGSINNGLIDQPS